MDRLNALKDELLEIEKKFALSNEYKQDPVSFPMRYKNPQDQEIVAFIAAAFSYGNVPQILKTLESVFTIIGPNPAKVIKQSTGQHWKTVIPKSFKHRFNTAEDLGVLLTWLGEALRRHQTLELFFCDTKVLPKNPISTPIDLLLESFVERLTDLPCAPFRKPRSKGALFFVPRPSGKSACKRMMLFLRWVLGKGPMDLALWNSIDRSQLLIPVDTHVLRISQNLGMTKRKDNTWRTAVEITTYLKQLDSSDPTRFDFALCHMGISNSCPSHFSPAICHTCGMNKYCVRYKNEKAIRTK